MLKIYNYMLTIVLYPFIMLLSYLKFTNYIKGSLYTYLIVFMIIIFIPSFIMSLYNSLDEILNSKKKWRIILIILLSIFYLPIYYTKYVSKEEKYLGYILFVISIPLSILAINSFNNRLYNILSSMYKNSVVINENYIIMSSNRLFSINVDKTFRCTNQDIGDYVVFCDRLKDDSFIGVYSYDVSNDSDEEIKEKLEFHINQTIEYIKENNYTYEINNYDNFVQIDYDENSILITQNNYWFEESKYSLIVLKEVKKDLINYEEYQNMVNSVCFYDVKV